MRQWGPGRVGRRAGSDGLGCGHRPRRPGPPPQVNHGPDAVATNLLRYLWPDVTLVGGPAGAPVLLAFSRRRLFAVIVLSIRDARVVKIEAIADPAARSAG